MTRATQYRFIGAASIALVWITTGVYLGLARPELRSTIAIPYIWLQGLGLMLGHLIGRSAGALSAVILLWALVAAVVFAGLELLATAVHR